MTATLIRRAGALTLAAATTATVLTGCGAGIGAVLTFDDTEKAKITEIAIGGSSGDVMITGGPAAETQIKRIVSANGQDPEVSYRVDGGKLTLSTDCGNNCRVRYEITAPTSVKVTGSLSSGVMTLSQIGSADVRVSSGDIVLDRIAGDTVARAESGSIQANDLRGAVSLVSTSGEVMAHELAGGKPVKVNASSGDIMIGLAAPASVTARASSGDITLMVPEGAYRLIGPDRRDSENGNDQLNTDITSDPAAPNVLDLRAGSGDITALTTP